VGIKLKNMNRNTQNWLKAICLTIGVLSGMGLVALGLAMFYTNYPQYFIHSFVIILGGMALFGVIRLVKDGLDDEDASDKYWEETYPSYSKAKNKKETHKEFMERLGDAWERDFGKKE
jgi:hypothetical protein